MIPRESAAQKTWPSDEGGVPAPPCTYYDPITQLVTYCNTLTPMPTTATVTITPPQSPSAFGQGYFTGWDGVVGLALQSAPAFLFLDETTLVGVGSRSAAGLTANLYRSTDGGRTMSLTTITTGNNTTGLHNMVRTTSGLYVIGTVASAAGSQVQTSRDLSIFTKVTAGLPVPGSSTHNAVYGANNTVLVTEDVGQNVCRATVSGFTLGTFTCAVPPTWTGPAGGASAPSMFSLAPSTGAGSAGGIWLGVDKASPNANIIRSTNDGATFANVTTLGIGTSGVVATAVLCLRNSPAICLIGLNGTLYRSADSGATWASVAAFTIGGLAHAFLDYGQGTVVAVGSPFGTASPVPPTCPPDCSVAAGIQWARSTDAGQTWTLVPGGLGAVGGNTGDSYTSAVTSPTTGRAILSMMRVAQNCYGSSNPATCYIYSPVIPPSGSTGFSSGSIGSVILNHGEVPQAGPVQAGTLFNSQTTGAATTAVTVTITGISGYRVHVYSVEARCNTGAATTTGITLTDAGNTKWTTGPTDVPAAATNYRRPWTPGYTAADGASVVLTLAACSAGTGTLIVQADQF